MEIEGAIAAPADATPVDRAQWIALCKGHPNLAPVPPRFAPNPFKPGQTMEVRAPADSVRIVVNSHDVGSMSWAEDDSALVNVSGHDPIVVDIAIEIAKSLSAVFTTYNA